jgi:hypothetical protein
MAQIKLHPDFRDFLKLLNSHGVKYLIVGGYAVGYYGYRNMNVWIAVDAENAAKTASALREFGMPKDEVTETLFLQKDAIIRMGIPPVRIGVITNASGVDFNDCYEHRVLVKINEITVNFISLDNLKRNKKACGRHKDLDDLEHLP